MEPFYPPGGQTPPTSGPQGQQGNQPPQPYYPPQGIPQGAPPPQAQWPYGAPPGYIPPQPPYQPPPPMYPQQPYYPPQPMPVYRPVPPPFQAERKSEKRAIRRMGNLIGLAVVAFVILQNILSLPVALFGQSERFASDGLFYYSFYIFLSILGVALPFVLLGILIKKEQPYTLYPLGRPKDALVTVLALPIGMGVCMAANIVTNIIINFFRVFHIYMKQPESPSVSSGWLASTVFFVAIAIIPALCEEISLRGVAMQSMKKYGGVFALAASSVVFGLMHGNMVQIPFAMMAGGIMAYFVLKTNSLWPGILIHFANNGTSAVLELVSNRVTNEKLLLLINAGVIWGWILIGIIAAGILFWRRRDFLRAPLTEVPSSAPHLKNGEKFGAFFSSAGMIAAIVIMSILTLMNIQFGGIAP